MTVALVKSSREFQISEIVKIHKIRLCSVVSVLWS